MAENYGIHRESYWQGWRHGAIVATLITSLVWWLDLARFLR